VQYIGIISSSCYPTNFPFFSVKTCFSELKNSEDTKINTDDGSPGKTLPDKSLPGVEHWNVADECESMIDAVSLAVGSGCAKLHNILV
jgi:hypothetical protein